MKSEYEDGVQNDVAHSTHNCGYHAEFGEPLGGDEGVHSHDNHDKDNAQDVDAGIGQGVGKGHVAGAEKP